MTEHCTVHDELFASSPGAVPCDSSRRTITQSEVWRPAAQRTLPSWNSSNRTEKAPRNGAHDTSSIGRTVSPSTALKNVAPFA